MIIMQHVTQFAATLSCAQGVGCGRLEIMGEEEVGDGLVRDACVIVYGFESGQIQCMCHKPGSSYRLYSRRLIP